MSCRLFRRPTSLSAKDPRTSRLEGSLSSSGPPPPRPSPPGARSPSEPACSDSPPSAFPSKPRAHPPVFPLGGSVPVLVTVPLAVCLLSIASLFNLLLLHSTRYPTPPLPIAASAEHIPTSTPPPLCILPPSILFILSLPPHVSHSQSARTHEHAPCFTRLLPHTFTFTSCSIYCGYVRFCFSPLSPHPLSLVRVRVNTSLDLLFHLPSLFCAHGLSLLPSDLSLFSRTFPYPFFSLGGACEFPVDLSIYDRPFFLPRNHHGRLASIRPNCLNSPT